MAIQHTPPNKFSSDTNIPMSLNNENETLINTRKRKQPDNDDLVCLEEKFNKQLLIWDSRMTECIASAVNTAITSEMTKITSVLSELNKNIIKLNTDNVNINKTLTETNKRLSEMEKSLNFTSERQDLFDNRLKTIEDGISHTTSVTDQIGMIEHKISLMEQQARQCNIEISNMPERRTEHLINIIERLGEAIKYPIRASDMITVHRVPHAESKNPRPKNVIVKFTNKVTRDNVISAYRAVKGLDSTKLSINGSPTTIYINEHLTLSNKLLFRQCREAAKKQEYKYVWVKHGTILVRKSDTSHVLPIRSPQDLAKIK